MEKTDITLKNLWQNTTYKDYPDEVYLTKYYYLENLISAYGFSYAHINKPIDFKRNVHLFLKDQVSWAISWLDWFQVCLRNYGMTVVISKNPSSQYNLYNLGQNYLLHGMKGILVIAFKFADGEISIFDCLDKTCEMDKPTKSLSFTYYSPIGFIFNGGAGTYSWNILYDYQKELLSIYSGDPSVSSNLKLSYNVNVAQHFPSGLGFLGFTATDFTCGFIHNLKSSFICTNGGDKITPKVSLVSGEESAQPGEVVSVAPSSKVTLKVEYGTEIESYIMGKGNLYINEEDNSEKIEQYDENEYQAIFYTGTTTGEQITVTYTTFYESFIFTINIATAEVQSLKYYYGKSKNEQNCFYISEDGAYRVLQYGALSDTYKTGCGGNFELAEFEEDGYLYFFVRAYDQYGNLANINATNLVEYTQLNAVSTGGVAKVKMNKVVDYVYKIGIEVKAKGTYTVTSSMLDKSIKFFVRNLIPGTNSKCKLNHDKVGYVYSPNEEVTYTCTYKDSEGNDIDLENAIEELDIEFTGTVVRLANDESQTDTKFDHIEKNIESNSIVYKFTPTYNGYYKFTAEYKYSIGTAAKINSKYNYFDVVPTPSTFVGAKFYNFKNKQWIDKNKLAEEIFLFNNEDDLFAIDLVDDKDPFKTSFADMENGYAHFDINNLNGKILENHSGYEKNVQFDFVEINSKKYILCKLTGAKNEFRRTSFNYLIEIKLSAESEEMVQVIFKVELTKVGDYTACRKDMCPSNSKLILKNEKMEISAGEILTIGDLVLLTDCEEEDHLYNYFLSDSNAITFRAKNILDDEPCDVCIFPLNKNSEIDGVYQVQFTSKMAQEFLVEAFINNESIKEGFNSYKIKVNPLANAFYLEKITDEEKSKYNVDNQYKFDFLVKDEYSNRITYPLTSSDFNNNLGLTYTLSIDGIDYSNILKYSTIIQFVQTEDYYSIIDSFTKAGKYVLTVGTKSSEEKITFTYYKAPGSASAKFSRITVTNPKQLLLEEKSVIQIDLYDNYDNYIGNDKEILEDQIDIVTAFAENPKYDTIQYSEKDIEGTALVFKSQPIENIGIYQVYGRINDVLIENCISCSFEVVDYGFSFRASQLKMVSEKTILMTENSYYTLYEGLQKPGFEFDFLTIEGTPSKYVDPSIDINAVINIEGEDEPVTLDKQWTSENTLFWSFPNDFVLEKGNKYDLKIISNDEAGLEKVYYLNVVEYGEDISEETDYDLSNTLISPNVLYLTAGKEGQIVIEFKDRNGLRFAGDLNIEKLHINIPQKFIDNNGIKIKASTGIKKGQIILEVISTFASKFADDLALSFSYDSTPLDKSVIIVTEPDELNFFDIELNCYYDEPKHQLQPGTTDNIPKIQLTPFDKYGNIITDKVFNTEKYPEYSFAYLFGLTHNLEKKVSITSTINPALNLVILSIQSESVGTLTLSSKYLRHDYTIEVLPGKASTKSIGQIVDPEKSTPVGSKKIFIIEPRDNFGNVLTEEGILDSKDNFKVRVYNSQGAVLQESQVEMNNDNGLLECEINTDKEGVKIVKGFYNENEITLFNNVLYVGQQGQPGVISYCQQAPSLAPPDAIAGKKYEYRIICFDSEDSLIKINEKEFPYIVENENGYSVESSTKSNSDGSLSIIIIPKIVGTYGIDSVFFDEEKYFTVLPGEVDQKNSYLELKSTAQAGENVDLLIHCFDEFNNRIYFDKEDDKFTGFFDIYYRYMKENEGEFSDYELVQSEPVIEQLDNEKNAIKYVKKIEKSGMNDFKAIFISSGDILRCRNCQMIVSPGELSLSGSELFTYDDFSDSLKKIQDSKTVLYNENYPKLSIRFYPKDSFQNPITIEALSDEAIRISLNNLEGSTLIQLVENTEEEQSNEYLSFKENGNDFGNLQGGEYIIKIQSKEESIEISVTIAGKHDQEFFGDDELDLSKTVLLEKSLDFLVGEYGYFIFELRNKNNIRYKGAFNKEVQVLSDTDDTIETIIINQHSSTILVLVSSKKANTFPRKVATVLKVIIDSNEVLNLDMYVHPGKLYSAEIKNDYLIPEKHFTLKTITADELLKFSILGYDFYKNKVLISETSAKLVLLSNSGEEIYYISSNNNLITGEQFYIYSIDKVGNYFINAGKNGENIDLFEQAYTVEIIPGAIDPEMSIIKINKDSIIAGETASVSILPKDKKNNNIEINSDEGNLFSVYLTNEKDEAIPVEEAKYENNQINYEIELTKKGGYLWNFKLNDEKVACYGCTTQVKSSIAYPKNTEIFSRVENGSYKKYQEDDYLYSHVDSPLSIHLVLKDKYENIIDKLYGDEILFKDLFLDGNYMKSPLLWQSEINSEYSQYNIDLDLHATENKNILDHLVEGINENAYQFTITMEEKTTKEAVTFEFKVNHYTNKDDQEYGNGDYSLEKSTLSENAVTFRVGEYGEVILELRTEQGKLFNDDINLDRDINCLKLTPDNYVDESFTCTISKKDKNYGRYLIKYYSEKVKTEEENIKNIIQVLNPANNQMETLGQVLIINTFGVPDKEKTKIISTLPETIEDLSEAVITYQLFDKYGNKYKNMPEIIENLGFFNHDIQIAHQTTLDSEDGVTYISKVVPQYPPKEVSIMLKFIIDEQNSVDLFNSLQKSLFDYKMDIHQTLVTSKNANKMKAGDLLDIQVTLYDEKHQCFADETFNPELLSVVVQGPLETTTKSITYGFKKVTDKDSACGIYYTIDINDQNKYTIAGSYGIVVYVSNNEEEIIAASYSQILTPGNVDPSKFVIYYDTYYSYNYNEIPAGSSIFFFIQAYDSYKNKIDYMPITNFDYKAYDLNDDPIKEENYNKKISTYGNGLLRGQFQAFKSGTYKMKYIYNDEIINPDVSQGPNIITYIAGNCNIKYPHVEFPPDETDSISNDYIYKISCYDEFNNKVIKGGADFSSQVTLLENQIKIDIVTTITDNNDGTYQISFKPPLIGEYSIYTYLEDDKYGQEKVFNLTEKKCAANEYMCPNIQKCVKDLRDCIPEEYRCKDSTQKTEKPFYCQSRGTEQCVKSMQDCDYDEEKYVRCGHMNVIIDIEKDWQCSFVPKINCKRKYSDYPIYCNDGICRTSLDLSPSQRVCPIGTYLCPDLTCAKSLEECHQWEDCPSENDYRCSDQSCVSDGKDCPSTVTCSNPNQVVCPDGTCVDNEIYCNKLKTCPSSTPYLCSDNSCASVAENCPHNNVCGHGKSLCEDLICRETCS